MVRAAVLKMKDPRQIIRDMEKLDEMGVYLCFIFCVLNHMYRSRCVNMSVLRGAPLNIS